MLTRGHDISGWYGRKNARLASRTGRFYPPRFSIQERLGLHRVRLDLDPTTYSIGGNNAPKLDQVVRRRCVFHESVRYRKSCNVDLGCRGDLGRVFFDQASHCWRNLSTVVGEVLNAIQLQTQVFLAFASDGVVETQTLDEATITAITRLGGYNVVKRTLFGATTGQANYHH